jgi:AraC family transcriptional regulator of adaptative response/methylated-DNA-[protein]-cysteine methyltransferase
VRFYATPDAAEAAGLRACKRCAPDQHSREEAAVMQALGLLRDAEEAVPLERLGAITGYSPTHFQRIFTRAVGMSPAAYARALRRERAGEALTQQKRVTDAIYAAGYGAHWAQVPTTLGPMLVAATEKGVCCLSFNEGEDALRARFPKAELVAGGAGFRALFTEVAAAVEKPGTGQAIPLDVKGTAFQQRVWEELRRIPPGQTLSYGQLAARLGQPKASRAVGGANGANNIAVLIPCHRVIAADGSLGGYAYGLEIKAELLRRER